MLNGMKHFAIFQLQNLWLLCTKAFFNTYFMVALSENIDIMQKTGFRRLNMCEQCGCGSGNAEKTLADNVKEVIEVIRPNLQSHGGDIEFISVEQDNSVKVRLQGACSGCPGAMMTLKMGVEKLLKEKIPEVKEVIAVD